MKTSEKRILLAITLIMLAVLYRLMPHPANFTPVAAVALFGGTVLPKRWALSLPLLAMIASDLLIGLHPLIFFTWGSFAAIALISHYFLKKVSAGSVVLSSVGASILFFVVTNFAVWAEGRLYDRTFAGLATCFVNALPFFRNTLFGDLVFSGLLFGAFALAGHFASSKHLIIGAK